MFVALPGEVCPGHQHHETVAEDDVLFEQVDAPPGEFLVALWNAALVHPEVDLFPPGELSVIHSPQSFSIFSIILMNLPTIPNQSLFCSLLLHCSIHSKNMQEHHFHIYSFTMLHSIS